MRARPTVRPARPNFGSGPCAKRPGWQPAVLADALVGRSHRTPAGQARLREVIERSRALLGLPAGMRLAIVPGSDTGAIEMALWSLLGPRPVDVLAFDVFSRAWARDVTAELRLPARVLAAADGDLPDLAEIDFAHDVVFAWNGTSTGVRLPDTPWIPATRTGLTVCYATSAVYGMPLPWESLDVVTWSWQKVLGGEAAHGMLALSARAIERLRSYRPERPLPKVFRLAHEGVVNEALFDGAALNTPSLLCVEDALDGLRWAEAIGGLPALHARTQRNFDCVASGVAARPTLRFLARDPARRSPTSMCLEFTAEAIRALPREDHRRFVDGIVTRLAGEGVAFDIGHHRDAPPGLRLWGGATVETDDLACLLPWLDWAYDGEYARWFGPAA